MRSGLECGPGGGGLAGRVSGGPALGEKRSPALVGLLPTWLQPVCHCEGLGFILLPGQSRGARGSN